MNDKRTLEALKKALPSMVSEARYKHIQRVAAMCEVLALQFDLNPEKCLIAAYAHDYAREWSSQDLQLYVRTHQIASIALEQEKPVLLHGKVAKSILEKHFSYQDPQVLEAVENHTLGKPGMGAIARLLFVADYAEPGRKYLDEAWRKNLMGKDLPCMVKAVILHAQERHKDAHPLTLALLEEVSLECK